MSIRIIAVGKKHEDWVESGIERYQKRLKRPFLIEWDILPHSSLDGLSARQEESRRIISRLNAHDYVILLDEHGKNLSSPELTEILQKQLNISRPISIIIGGAYGVDETIMERADLVWSLSKLVFPHQLVRLILTEQLYRAQEIDAGRPYHHS